VHSLLGIDSHKHLKKQPLLDGQVTFSSEKVNALGQDTLVIPIYFPLSVGGTQCNEHLITDSSL
jgi:hypothetical protein